MGNATTKSDNLRALQSETERQFVGFNTAPTTLSAIVMSVTAVINNDTALLKRLKKFGVSVNATDREGNTPLHIAVINESLRSFNFLVDVKDIQIDAVNLQGSSALIMAVAHDREYYVLKLIEKGADVRLVDTSGCTPLHYAVRYSSVKICKILIKRRADLNARNLLGETVLHWACQNASAEKICMLLYYGADASIPSGKGYIPLLIPRVNSLDMYLRVMLYHYTFDSEKVTVELTTLIRMMVLSWPLFPAIISQISDVIYDRSDLRYLNDSLPDIKLGFFQLFFEHFDYIVSEMLQNYCTLTNYLTSIEGLRRVTPEFMEFLYIFLQSPLVHDFIRSRCISVSTIACLVKIFRKNNMSLGALTELVCCMLSYGMDVTPVDLNAVYVIYGRCELFEIMLHMNLERSDGYATCCALYDYEVMQKSIMPYFIYDTGLNIDRFLENPKSYLLMDLDVLLEYFALPKLKDFFLADCSSKTVNKVKKLPTVPYLVELARNSTRDHIIKKYHVRNSSQFYTIIKWFPVSNVYKKILSFERKLYDV